MREDRNEDTPHATKSEVRKVTLSLRHLKAGREGPLSCSWTDCFLQP